MSRTRCLVCGRLEEGFLRVRCEVSSHERLVAFSYKRHGFCTSCGVGLMVETAALLEDHVLPHRPFRQLVLSFPYPLCFELYNHPQVMGTISERVARYLERQEWLNRDE